MDVANFPYSESANLQRLFARTIKINCVSIGEYELAKKAIDYEINATKIYKKNKFKSHSNYYRTKYQNDKLKNQIKYRCEFYWFRFVQGWICGHFEQWYNPLASMILVILFCTLWICFLQNDICHFYRYFKEILSVFFGVRSSSMIPIMNPRI